MVVHVECGATVDLSIESCKFVAGNSASRVERRKLQISQQPRYAGRNFHFKALRIFSNWHRFQVAICAAKMHRVRIVKKRDSVYWKVAGARQQRCSHSYKHLSDSFIAVYYV